MSERVELELNLKGGDKAVKTLGQLEQELNDARDAIKEVEVGSQAFETLAQKIQNTGSEIKVLEKNMESLEPQQKAEAFLKMGEGIAGGFAVAQGALALAGVESESLEKVQVKVQAAISIAMGVRMMSEAALMATTAKRVIAEKLALVQTKLGTALAYAQSVAMGIWGTSQAGVTVAVGGTTAAMKLLRLAIAATGIGALVLAITAIGVAVYNWATATDATADAQANLNEKLVKENEQFLKNRDLQKELAAAETKNEKLLVSKTNSLNNVIEKLKENNKNLEENEEKLRNLNDFSKEEQKQILKTAKTLERRNKNYQDGITLLDRSIDKTKEAIAADEEAARKEKERDDERKRRRDERKAQRKQEAEELRTLEQEIELLRIKDAKNFKEQEALINEKFDKLEADRQAAVFQEIIDNELEIFNQGVEKRKQIRLEEEEEKKAADEKAAQEQIELDQKVAEAKAGIATTSFELAKKLGGENKKIQKGIAISETAFNTGVSITRALKDIPAPFGVIQAGIHAGIGAAQIAAIAIEKIADVNGEGGGSTDIVEPMLPSSTGAFTLGGVEQQAVKAFVVESEITDSQAQMADINRRSTI